MSDVAETVAEVNRRIEEAEALLPWSGTHPVGKVRWVHVDEVQANNYNPNSVPTQEMRLLHTSITEDGYTQPVVVIKDEENHCYTIVDGFHRYTVMKRFADVSESSSGYLPVVIIDKPIEDRIASTVRHNRARGKHSVQGMGNLVFEMLRAGEDDLTICRKIGVDADELVRLKHVTGYSKLYEGVEAYSPTILSGTQVKAKGDYKRENPDEVVPQF